jgi:hypothetical protein
MVAARLKEKYGMETTLVNPAIGGTELRQNMVLIPLWAAKTPEPDLVAVCFGYNDRQSGMRGPMVEATLKDAVDRIRRATGGKADVLVMTPCPSLEKWDEMAEAARGRRCWRRSSRVSPRRTSRPSPTALL